MRGMTLRKIAAACKGVYFGNEVFLDREVCGVSIDSRQVEKGFLFAAVRGARVDGHDFIKDVFERGALCVISEKKLSYLAGPYILVESSLQALKEVAAYYRSVLDITVVGITGSVGKTSTKEMVSAVLSQRLQVLKTAGNFNNEIGLPLTIFRIRDEHQVAVLEMGINHFGEMHRLSRIARPDICVITNIGECHLEHLQSRDGILSAKSEIFDFWNPQGRIFLNGDDDKLRTVTKVKGRQTEFFGLSKDCRIKGERIRSLGLQGTACVIRLPGQELEVLIPVPGEHMVRNALAAAAVGDCLGLTGEEIRRGIKAVESLDGRSNLIITKRYSVLDDCYNANPVSMKAALDLLADVKGHRTAILGDMGELGGDSSAYHKQIGRYAVEKGIDTIVCIGSLAQDIYQGALAVKGRNKVFYYPAKEDFLERSAEILQQDDTVLVKASHSMGFEEIVSALT